MAAKDLGAFGSWLADLRRQKGVSQARLVRDLNDQAGCVVIGLRTVSRWENGDNEPYLSELAPVVRYLGGSIEDAAALIAGTGRHKAA